jgi:hypothetical protein
MLPIDNIDGREEVTCTNGRSYARRTSTGGSCCRGSSRGEIFSNLC